jgi:hypothetical protein
MAAFHMDRHPLIVYVKALAPFASAEIKNDSPSHEYRKVTLRSPLRSFSLVYLPKGESVTGNAAA